MPDWRDFVFFFVSNEIKDELCRCYSLRYCRNFAQSRDPVMSVIIHGS